MRAAEQFVQGQETALRSKLGLPLRLAATLECNVCGFCNLGCWNGTKKSTLEVHIPHALSRVST